MSLFLLVAALAVQTAKSEPITVVGRPFAPFVSPMGEPFRVGSADEDALVKWFRQADRDSDGRLELDELTADGERFFAVLDTDRDGQILPTEFVAYEWEIAPEIQTNSRWRPAYGEARRLAKGRREPDTLQGAARYGLLNIPQPVAAADANFDRAVSREEFRRAAAYRFQLLDRQQDLGLTIAELQVLRPAPRDQQRSRRPGKNERDARIGNPLPPSN